MLISIITPTFNSEKTIAQVIDSIKAQSYENWEHIIIDNQSSDKTLEIVKSKHTDLSKVKIISEADEGISDAFNKGMIKSDGDILIILNSDDFFIPKKLLSQVVNIFKRDNSVDFIHGDIFFEDDIYGTNCRGPLLCSINKALPFNHPGFFIRRNTFFKIGLFLKSFKFAMDYEWFCRMYDQKGKLIFNGYYLKLDEPLVFMRGGGVSWANEEKIVSDMKKALELHGLDQELSLLPLKLRLFRIKLKKALSKLGLNFVVKLWRRVKWS